MKTPSGRGTGPCLVGPSWWPKVPSSSSPSRCHLSSVFCDLSLTAYQLTCPARPLPNRLRRAEFTLSSVAATAQPAMTWLNHSQGWNRQAVVSLISRTGLRRTTVLADGEGHWATVVEECEEGSIANPWDTMTSEASPSERGGEELQATSNAPSQSAEEDECPERERSDRGPAPSAPPPAATLSLIHI